jgi:hypothetical protein
MNPILAFLFTGSAIFVISVREKVKHGRYGKALSTRRKNQLAKLAASDYIQLKQTIEHCDWMKALTCNE